MGDKDRAEGEDRAARPDDAENRRQDREVIKESDRSRDKDPRLEKGVNAREQVNVRRSVESFEIPVRQPTL